MVWISGNFGRVSGRSGVTKSLADGPRWRGVNSPLCEWEKASSGRGRSHSHPDRRQLDSRRNDKYWLPLPAGEGWGEGPADTATVASSTAAATTNTGSPSRRESAGVRTRRHRDRCELDSRRNDKYWLPLPAGEGWGEGRIDQGSTIAEYKSEWFPLLPKQQLRAWGLAYK